jgi:hypothetical protein
MTRRACWLPVPLWNPFASNKWKHFPITAMTIRFFDLSQNPSILKVPRPSSWVFTTSSTWLATSTARIEESLPTSGRLEYSTIFPRPGVSLRYSANPLFFRLARSSDSSGDETPQSTRCGLVGGIDLNTGPKLAVTRC